MLLEQEQLPQVRFILSLGFTMVKMDHLVPVVLQERLTILLSSTRTTRQSARLYLALRISCPILKYLCDFLGEFEL